ncbi:galactoside alpha-(1,2)-fucosyltransferase 2-like [Gastrophryne carolinensis]
MEKPLLPSKIQDQVKTESPGRRKKIALFACIFLCILVFSLTYQLQLRLQCLSYPDNQPTVPQPVPNMSLMKTLHKSLPTEPRPGETGIWTYKPDGRLGNQMGQYATLYALAKANGHQAFQLMSMYNYLAPIFKVSMPVLHDNVAARVPFKDYWLHDWMSEEYNHLEGDFIRFTGYPCSWTFFHHLRDDIRRDFRIHDYLKNEANQVLERIRGDRKNVTFIGIHVRRGDYVTVMPEVWKGVIADRGYLEKAMAYFRNKYAQPVFVVASNGMEWCKENIDSSRGDVYFSGDGNEATPGKDFTLLASCNHTIMTVGTFGFWVGYLVGGETIYLTNFTLPESRFLTLFHYEAAFLPEWIGIAADLSPLKH